MSWYELKEMLFQAVKKQFRYVSQPVKSQIKRLSPAQLESVLDILPQFSDLQYLETHLTEVLSKPTPARSRDRYTQLGPPPERQFNREFTPPPPIPQTEEVFEDSEPQELDVEPPPPARIVDEPAEVPVANEPEESRSMGSEPVYSSRQPEVPEFHQPPVQRQYFKPSPPASRPSAPAPPPSGVVRATVPLSIEGTQLELVLEYDRFSDDKRNRGVRFSFTMDESQFLIAQLLTHRQHIQPLEPRVAEAIRSYFNEAEQVLQGAILGGQAAPAAPQRVEAKIEHPPVVAAPTPESAPAPPVVEPVTDGQASSSISDSDLMEGQAGKRHRRTNEELAAAGIAVGKRTRLTSEKIDLDSLQFDPRLASILSIDQARHLNIAPVSFLDNSTDLLVLFVEPEGKVRIYTFFNRAANRAAVAALVGIRPEKRDQVKIRTFRVSQDFMNQFLDMAATTEGSDEPSKPKRGRPAGSKNKPA
ncbi:MAG: hypothetical protein HY774_06995 [Acidobacteria bacterium]|nr:hypothetical protein [Acidobacteriota bacterium]